MPIKDEVNFDEKQLFLTNEMKLNLCILKLKINAVSLTTKGCDAFCITGTINRLNVLLKYNSNTS